MNYKGTLRKEENSTSPALRPPSNDSEYMLHALKLAGAAKGKTFPNPAVGAVVVSRGKITGCGATQSCGRPHAERVALARAGRTAAGATLYVTLEPCCHWGRTPPCTDAIIAAGVRRAVVAVADPNPLVNGKGIRRLRAAGIDVDIGFLEHQARAVNEDFFWAITRKRAWITLKLACTIDGRIADSKGDSQWITGGAARVFAHELRRRHAAVAVGRTTLEHDDPRLTVRHLKGFAPARCVFTSDISLPRSSYFVRHAASVRSIVVVAGKGKRRTVRDPRCGIEFWHTGEKTGRAHLSAFAEMAFENDITSVLIEGGRKLASSFLESGLVNRVYILYGNKILGDGTNSLLFSKGLPLKKGIRLKDREFFLLDDTIGITGIPDNLK